MSRFLPVSLAALSLLTIGGSFTQPVGEGEMKDLAVPSHFSNQQPVRVRFLSPEFGVKVTTRRASHAMHLVLPHSA
jgi:hypothetical protein